MDDLMRIGSTVYRRSTGVTVATFEKGSWYEPRQLAHCVELEVAEPAKAAMYEALPVQAFVGRKEKKP